MVNVSQASDRKTTQKLNKIEQAKAKKHPLLLQHELEHFIQIGWEAMDEFERDHGLKWLGFFHRKNRNKPLLEPLTQQNYE